MVQHFTVTHSEGKKRRGVIHTPHGDIHTPAFGPDATRGIIKNLTPHELENLSQPVPFTPTNTIAPSLSPPSTPSINSTEIPTNNAQRRLQDETQFILTNTYHMRNFPGDDFIAQMGGIHQFMQWHRPILTDSGGFQVFSLIHGSKDLKGSVTDDKATFQNPRTGSWLELTPENSIDIQFNLGSDIMIVLDDCRHYMDKKELENSVHRTIAWAKRSKAQFEKNLQKYHGASWETHPRPLLFAVVQGGIDYDLRRYCTEELVKIGFDGFGFGGWAINEKEYFPYDLLEFVADLLPADKPKYAMGVGTPENMLQCIEYGYDLFDCVIPSRNGRHGLCYTTAGTIKLHNSKYKEDFSSLDAGLESLASQYPKYYLHHLFKIEDPAGGKLLTAHNLKYFNYTMRQAFEDKT